MMENILHFFHYHHDNHKNVVIWRCDYCFCQACSIKEEKCYGKYHPQPKQLKKRTETKTKNLCLKKAEK